MYCANCGARSNAGDRFCYRCGAALATPGHPQAKVHTAPFERGESAALGLFRLVAGNLRWIMGAVIVGAIVVAIATDSGEKAVPEDPSSPGYTFVRDLGSSGEIDSYKTVDPEDGWESEYSINDGDAHIRFRGSELENEYTYADDGLKEAIRNEARSQGFSGE